MQNEWRELGRIVCLAHYATCTIIANAGSPGYCTLDRERRIPGHPKRRQLNQRPCAGHRHGKLHPYPSPSDQLHVGHFQPGVSCNRAIATPASHGPAARFRRGSRKSFPLILGDEVKIPDFG
jgi:hypothetical protein